MPSRTPPTSKPPDNRERPVPREGDRPFVAARGAAYFVDAELDGFGVVELLTAAVLDGVGLGVGEGDGAGPLASAAAIAADRAAHVLEPSFVPLT